MDYCRRKPPSSAHSLHRFGSSFPLFVHLPGSLFVCLFVKFPFPVPPFRWVNPLKTKGNNTKQEALRSVHHQSLDALKNDEKKIEKKKTKKKRPRDRRGEWMKVNEETDRKNQFRIGFASHRPALRPVPRCQNRLLFFCLFFAFSSPSKGRRSQLRAKVRSSRDVIFFHKQNPLPLPPHPPPPKQKGEIINRRCKRRDRP